MSDYLVSRSFSLKHQVAARPAGPAIIALQQANDRLERALPRQQSVPAYQPKAQAAAPAQAASQDSR
jgi:hypothetical protein